MAWCILNFVFCLTLLLPLGGSQTSSLNDSINASGDKATKSITPAIECDPLIRLTNGSKTNISISVYLNSKSCSKNISMRLKKIFQGNAQTRSDLVDIVGDLCSAYVNLTSVIIFKNLSICMELSLFSTQTLEQKFCSRLDMNEGEITRIKTDLDMLTQLAGFKFEEIHHHFIDLTSLNANDCKKKCGGNDSRVLCNAYYSMALLLSKNANILRVKIKGITSSTATPSHAADHRNHDNTPSQPIDTPPKQSRVLANSATKKLISKMAKPILSLSGDEIETLRKNVSKMSILTIDLVTRAFRHPNITSILEMFWLVKIAPPKLNSLNDSDDFDYVEKNNGTKFFELVTFPEEDKEKILHFKDLVTTLEYFKVYGDIVLLANDTGKGRSGNISDGHSNNAAPTHQEREDIGKDGNTKGGSQVQSGRQKDENTRKVEVSDNRQEQRPIDDQGHNGLAGQRGGQGQRVGQGEYDGTGQRDGPRQEYDDELSRILENREQVVDTRIQNTGQGDGGGKSSAGLNDRTSTDAGHKEKPTTSGTLFKEEFRTRGSSYGPLHFLSLFIVIAAIVIIGYICSHNRKKIREGVNGYMTGASKRRRTRDYKPLATSA